MTIFTNRFPTRSLESLSLEYDYIIIGGGTAGCVIANRLSTDPRVTTLLVELGDVCDAWWTRIPMFSQLLGRDNNRASYWDSLPLQHANGRVLELVSGKSLGGSSRINAMLYTRGVPAQFNAWATAGRKGWSYDDMEPYFVKSEHHLGEVSGTSRDFHGVSGEWKNRSYTSTFWGHSSSIIKAASTMGVPYVDDLNSPLHPPYGCAKMHYSIDDRGERTSTFSAFLPYPIVKARKDSLHICTSTRVQRIVFQAKPDGSTAIEGIYLHHANNSGQSRFIKARKEIILCAGAISSPQILMLSGIGPAGHLKKHGIPVIKELSGVGVHLQDHIAVPVEYNVPMHDSIIKLQMQPWLLILELLKYFLFGWGLLLMPIVELSLFIPTRLLDQDTQRMYPTKEDSDASRPENLPDVELMSIAYGKPENCKVTKQGGLCFMTTLLRPQSLGTIKLSSSDPAAKPIVDLNFLAAEQDLVTLRKAVKFVRMLKAQVAAQGYPISDRSAPSDSDEDMDSFIKSTCMTTSHYSSSCRMAPEAENGVVDDELRVYGIQGLRIADASIFPVIPSTHLMAPTVAVAEKCADLIQHSGKRDLH